MAENTPEINVHIMVRGSQRLHDRIEDEARLRRLSGAELARQILEQWLDTNGGRLTERVNPIKKRLYGFVDEIVDHGVEHWIKSAEANLRIFRQNAQSDPRSKLAKIREKRQDVG